MILASLKEASGLVGSRPVLWIPGMVTGLLIFTDLMTGYYGGTFLTGRLWLIEILVVPFLAGGLYFSVKTGMSPGKFIQAAGSSISGSSCQVS